MFEKGKEYHRRANIHGWEGLQGPLGGQWQGGISTPANYPVVLIFTGRSGHQHGYRDRWINDDVFEYWGKGQYGDMQWEGGNIALRDHIVTGEDIHLFEVTRKGYARYIDQMVHLGHRTDRGPDRAGTEREEIVHQLIRLTAISGTSPDPNSELQPALSIDALRHKALDASAASRPPLERKTNYRERSIAITQYARARAAGRCEGCQQPAPFTGISGAPFLEVHHVRRLSDGGPDHPRWVVAICPNCHRRAHYSTDLQSYNAYLTQIAQKLES
jgi:5-methylcytosine-specific restriction protein A